YKFSVYAISSSFCYVGSTTTLDSTRDVCRTRLVCVPSIIWNYCFLFNKSYVDYILLWGHKCISTMDYRFPGSIFKNDVNRDKGALLMAECYFPTYSMVGISNNIFVY